MKKGTNYLFRVFCLFMLTIFTAGSYAQTAREAVKGVVYDEAGVPVDGATVKVFSEKMKYSFTTRTNDKGIFIFKTLKPGGPYHFSISHIGHASSELTGYTYKENEVITLVVNLSSESSNLGEMVVIGYGTQKKGLVTGAISTLDNKTLTALPVPSVTQALQGRVPGLSVTSMGGPGVEPIINIRGIGSVNGYAGPLYVIDGIAGGNLSNFDNNDVQSIDVLKDASAAAIYGSRGTNGVIIITTQKGQLKKKLSVTVNTLAGIEDTHKRIDLMNTDQYLQYAYRLMATNPTADTITRLKAAGLNSPIYAGAATTFRQTNTDWQDQYFKRGLLTGNNVSVSGGSDRSRFYTSAGYFRQEGIVVGKMYERGNFRINSEHELGKNVTFGENLFLSFSKQRYEGATTLRSRLVMLTRAAPYMPVYDPTRKGGYVESTNGLDGFERANPVEEAVLPENYNNAFKMLGSAYVNIRLAPWLSFKSTFGTDYFYNVNSNYTPSFDDNARSVPLAALSNATSKKVGLTYTQQFTFDKQIGEHHLNLIAAYEQQNGTSNNSSMSGSQATDGIKTYAGATNVTASSTLSENTILSYIGRLTYDYAGKYLLNVSVRRDGFSVWSPAKKYANFPSASIGWNLDRENFMKSQEIVSQLKLRGGYGLTGYSSVGDYDYQSIVLENNDSYPFGNQLIIGNGTYYSSLTNKNLEWEITKQADVGVDVGFLKNKFSLSADVYNRKSTNMIVSVPTVLSIGYSGVSVPENLGAIQNKGIDLQLGYHKRKGVFTMDITGIYSSFRNKVLKLNRQYITGGGAADFGVGALDPTKTEEGMPFQYFYGFVTDGIFQSQAEVDKSPVQVAGKTAAGDIKFKDLDGNKIIDANDRTFLGNYFPKFSYSLNYEAHYKNFDLTLFFQGVQGNKIYNAIRIYSEGMFAMGNADPVVLNAWTPQNTNTSIPRASLGDASQNTRTSDRFLEDGSYLRLKTINLAYNFTEANLSHFLGGTFSNIRLFVSSLNFLTFTKYTGWDPEIGTTNGSFGRGVDYGQNPPSRSFQFGMQVKLK